ncbi:hypothetical protein CWI84_11360 [Idiomarina tyrosinivorans]|uniref:Uncharacterized protein n=1 Tax=Idiomarina tyrosinivorans TaxID=1445662 RepID=A0A432ZFA9_9GAMM|nr:hypothetical protein [Idiomarina tyrosinivorans]RUO76589.1 hypothetical protein CWI84_11360 [Idiomarina tyrosinivorans]
MALPKMLGFVSVVVTLLLAGCQPAPDLIAQRLHSNTGSYVADIADDASFSVVAADNLGVALWQDKANQPRFRWLIDANGMEQIMSVDISADGSVVAAANRHTFSLWRVEDGEQLGYWKINDGEIEQVVVSDKGSTIVLAKGDGTQIAFNPLSGRRIEFYGHKERINGLAISPNGFYVLSGSNDFKALLWDTRSGQVIRSWQHESRVTQVALQEDGEFAFTADSKDNARIWSIASGKKVSQLQFFDRQRIFSAARFGHEGKYLLTGSPSRRITIWRTSDGEALRHWRASLPEDTPQPASAALLSVAVNPKATVIMTENSAGLAEWWNINLASQEEP